MKEGYETFKERMKQETERMMGDLIEVSLREIPKNNGTMQSGLVFRRGDTAAVVYLEGYFWRYEEGEELKELAAEVCRSYEEHKEEIEISRAGTDFGNYEAIKEKIVYKLVDYGRNRKLLEKIPHRRFCDLAVVFSVLAESSPNYQAAALIHHEHRKAWGIDTEKLMELAEKNTPKLFPAELKSMGQVMREIAGRHLEGNEGEEPLRDFVAAQEEIPLYLLSNRMNLNGAAVILYDGVLKDFADRIGIDLIILPSSIHEVLLIPFENSISMANLKEMVMYINQTEVLEEEVLSDNVYLYCRETDSVSIAGQTD